MKDRCEKVAIFGIGGVGKSQLALEFAYRVQESNQDCSIFWIPASSNVTLRQGYLKIARLLNIHITNEERVFSIIQETLSSEAMGKWLLIYDNADDYDMWAEPQHVGDRSIRLIDCLPSSRFGSILFTTRSNYAVLNLFTMNKLGLKEMDSYAADLLLQSMIKDDRVLQDTKASSELLRRLSNLPFALSQAALYINKNSLSISEYISLLDELKHGDLEHEMKYEEPKDPIAAITSLLSIEDINQKNDLAVELLSLMGPVVPRATSRSLLSSDRYSPEECDATIATLLKYSISPELYEHDTWDIDGSAHPTVCRWLEESLAKWVLTGKERDNIASGNKDYIIRTLIQVYFPEIECLVVSSQHLDEEKENSIWLLYQYDEYLLQERKLDGVVTRRTPTTWSDDQFIAPVMENIATVRAKEVGFETAKELIFRVLQRYQMKYGREHENTLRVTEHLTGVYWRHGQFHEAGEIQTEVVRAKERVIGRKHPSTRSSLIFLAKIRMRQGQFIESKLILQEVLDEKLGLLTGVQLATTYLLLAIIWRREGRLYQAEFFQKEFINCTEHMLNGISIRVPLEAKFGLGRIYYLQGRFKEAVSLGSEVLKTESSIFGDDDDLVVLHHKEMRGWRIARYVPIVGFMVWAKSPICRLTGWIQS